MSTVNLPPQPMLKQIIFLATTKKSGIILIRCSKCLPLFKPTIQPCSSLSPIYGPCINLKRVDINQHKKLFDTQHYYLYVNVALAGFMLLLHILLAASSNSDQPACIAHLNFKAGNIEPLLASGALTCRRAGRAHVHEQTFKQRQQQAIHKFVKTPFCELSFDQDKVWEAKEKKEKVESATTDQSVRIEIK